MISNFKNISANKCEIGLGNWSKNIKGHINKHQPIIGKEIIRLFFKAGFLIIMID